jgi:hypothetical protein
VEWDRASFISGAGDRNLLPGKQIFSQSGCGKSVAATGAFRFNARPLHRRRSVPSPSGLASDQG